jgi:hypothetical protein
MSAICLRGQLGDNKDSTCTPTFWIQQFLCNHLKEDDDVTRSTMSSQGNVKIKTTEIWRMIANYILILISKYCIWKHVYHQGDIELNSWCNGYIISMLLWVR